MKIKCFGCGESGEYYPYVPSKVYCFSCYNKVVQERDKLKAENERLIEGMKGIIVFKNTWYKDSYSLKCCIEIAQQSLKEITRIKLDYREHLRYISESEYRRLHENKWDNSENEGEEICPQCGGSCSMQVMYDGGMMDVPCRICGGLGKIKKVISDGR